MSDHHRLSRHAVSFLCVAVVSALAFAGPAAAQQEPMSRRSPHETTTGTADGATIEISYGRPLMRGRVIMGELVPFGYVWRTGADEATQLTTDRDLLVGGHRLKAGTYSLFTKPEQARWSLIINAQTGMSGLERDAAKDVTTLAVTPSAVAAPVEQLTLAVVDTPAGGAITLRWEKTEVVFPFSVAD
jgi:hypothetical protein